MAESPKQGVLEIKKYPNRRFYDVTHSRHVTLADLHVLVRDGNHIHVTDSKTGDDITAMVLTHILLEHDLPKLELFPASLLHQAIQSNQQMIRRFIDQYFSQAMNAFVSSRSQFDEFLKRSGFSALQPMAPFDWVRMLFPQAGAASAEPAQTVTKTAEDPAVAALREQVARLSQQLANMDRSSAKPTKKSARSKKR